MGLWSLPRRIDVGRPGSLLYELLEEKGCLFNPTPSSSTTPKTSPLEASWCTLMVVYTILVCLLQPSKLLLLPALTDLNRRAARFTVTSRPLTYYHDEHPFSPEFSTTHAFITTPELSLRPQSLHNDNSICTEQPQHLQNDHSIPFNWLFACPPSYSPHYPNQAL